MNEDVAKRLIVNKLNSITSNNGVKVTGISVEGDTTLLATELTSLAIKSAVELASWDSVAGNSILYVYYTGVGAGNPSGSKENIKTITYKQGAITVLTQTFAWNDKAVTGATSDQVVSLTAV